MPIDVDVAARLDEIAEATLRVVRREGPRGITIRNVAAELGGSTTVVTNYVPSRSALLLNVVTRAQRRWGDKVEELGAGLHGAELFRTIADWSATTERDDQEVRQLWLGLAAHMESDSATHTALREDARAHHATLRAALAESEAPDPDGGSDLMYLLLRGFYFAGVEDPELWNEDRVRRAVEKLSDLLLPASEGEER